MVDACAVRRRGTSGWPESRRGSHRSARSESRSNWGAAGRSRVPNSPPITSQASRMETEVSSRLASRRSRSRAYAAGSAASSRTAPSPFQCRRAKCSWRASACGQVSLSAARVPLSRRLTGMTIAPSPCRTSPSGVADHRSRCSSISAGSSRNQSSPVTSGSPARPATSARKLSGISGCGIPTNLRDAEYDDRRARRRRSSYSAPKNRVAEAVEGKAAGIDGGPCSPYLRRLGELGEVDGSGLPARVDGHQVGVATHIGERIALVHNASRRVSAGAVEKPALAVSSHCIGVRQPARL